MKHLLLFFFLTIVFCSCQNEKGNEQQAIKAATYLLTEISSPCKEGGQPNLFVSENRTVYLSWVEYLNDSTDALMFSSLVKEQWSEPVQIAQGSDWFTNWADFSALVAYKDGGNSLAAHWLAKSSSGTYDYDVTISQSLDGGKTWQKPFIPHTDGIAAEHGFVSMLPLDEERIFATWLDGRNTKVEGNDSHGHDSHGHGHGKGGPMTVRAAVFDKKNQLLEEAELDNRVCDCCQTSAAMTSDGLIVAYRDRSEDEIRDISYVRQVDGEWTTPKPVHKDNWKIAGCPVNGPKIAANGKEVAIVWFTMEGEQALVKIAFSSDAGASFGSPIRVDDGKPLGRVDAAFLDDKTVVVSWLENSEPEATIRLAHFSKTGKIGDSEVLLETDASRSSGFPILERVGERLVLAWTEVTEKSTRVKTAFVSMDDI